MRVTAIKGWDPLRENRRFKISRDFCSDLAEAVALEHRCEESCCDLCHALAAGYPRVAADLLSSALESLLLADLYQAHGFNRTFNPQKEDSSANEWEEWLRYWGTAEEEGRLWNCPSCNAWNWDSTVCGSCSPSSS